MGEPGRVYPAELHLLRKELEVQGELLNQERLERKTESDRLRLEVESLKKLLEELHAGSSTRLQRLYDEEVRSLNPELTEAGLGKKAR